MPVARRVRDGGGEYAMTASGKSVFCARNGFRVSTGRGRRHVRLIRLISGPLGFAAAREAAVGEIAGARCPSRKKADFREYCKRPATGRGGGRRHLRSARGHKSSEAPEFGPTRYLGDDHAVAQHVLPRHGHESISGRGREARRPADERHPSHAAVPLRARRRPAVIAEYIAQFTPDAPDIWSTDEMYAMVKKAMRCLYPFMGRGTRRLPGAKSADAKKTAGMAPLAQEAKEPASKMPEAAPGTAAQA